MEKGYRGWELGIGDVYCILLYMICFGEELGILESGLDVSVLDRLVGWSIGYVGGVRCASLA